MTDEPTTQPDDLSGVEPDEEEYELDPGSEPGGILPHPGDDGDDAHDHGEP
ncbi:hypothetical protein ABN028_19990 [Actinopolymorpha sp. B17G11]|uniref:hypothetical protein n=1 Tax=Actinopolymorpha sp. B17G11 TaxID=3160861 RepID=UPI0032E45707